MQENHWNPDAVRFSHLTANLDTGPIRSVTRIVNKILKFFGFKRSGKAEAIFQALKQGGAPLVRGFSPAEPLPVFTYLNQKLSGESKQAFQDWLDEQKRTEVLTEDEVGEPDPEEAPTGKAENEVIVERPTTQANMPEVLSPAEPHVSKPLQPDNGNAQNGEVEEEAPAEETAFVASMPKAPSVPVYFGLFGHRREGDRDSEDLKPVAKPKVPVPDDPLHQAIDSEDVEKMIELINDGAKLTVQNIKGQTPLHLALEKELPAVYSLLIQKDPHSVTDANGDTPLHIAAESGFLDAVEALTKDESDLLATNKRGDTPGKLARRLGREDVILYFVSKLSPEKLLEGFGENLLSEAVFEKRKDRAENFLKHGFPIELKGLHGRTAMHIAMGLEETETTRVLFQQQRLPIAVQDEEGNTALHLAIDNDRIAIVTGWIQEGRNLPWKAENDLLQTPLHRMAMSGSEEMLGALLDRMDEEEIEVDLTLEDLEGKTAYDYALGTELPEEMIERLNPNS